MMKFFRKYNKQMLAVFMVLLLVVWLAGDAFQAYMNPDQSGALFATSKFGSVTRGEWEQEMRHTKWLGLLGLPWQYPSQAQTEPLDQAAWYLLTKEARAFGINSSHAVVQNVLKLTDDRVLRLAQQNNVKPEVIYQAAGAFTDVLRYLGKMSQAASVNEAELRLSAHDSLHKVQVKAAVLRADMYVDPAAPVTESELAEQFDKFKDKQRAGKGMNFGYLLPPRVKIQYLKLEPARLEDQIVETEKLVQDARRYWSENREKDPAFRRPADAPASQPDDPASQPASAPASQPAFVTKWAEAKDAAMKVIRKRAAAKEALAVADWFRTQANEPWVGVARGEDGFLPAPAAAQALDHYEALLKTAPATLKGLSAAAVSTTDWLSPETMADMPGLSTATVPNAEGMPISVRQLAFNVQGLAVIPKDEEDGSRVDRNTFSSRFQTCPYVLQDEDGNVYVLRVIETDGERAPRDISEVREQVEADVRFSKAYALAQAAAEKLREKAAADGLAAAWEADTELKDKVAAYNALEEAKDREAGFNELNPFARRGFGSADYLKFVPKLGQVNSEFLEACFALGADPAAGPKVKALSIPESGSVVVVEWVKDVAADQTMFANMKSFLNGQLQQSRQGGYLGPWVSPQQIRSRNQFEFKSEG